MGNVLAAGISNVPTPPIAAPPIPSTGAAIPAQSEQTSPIQGGIPATEDTGPGTFEDLHKKCKDVFPVPFEGAKLLINKGLSNHFQISHTLTMSSLLPSGYRFGCTYVGTKQYGPTEAFPIMIGDVDPSGNLNAQIMHQFTRAVRCKFVSQIQNNKFLATQFSTDYRTANSTTSLTVGNPDIVNESGVVVAQYLQNVSSRVTLGSELLYQYGQSVPGSEIAIYTLAAKYTGDSWQTSANLTPAAGGLHVCYHQRATDNLQIGVEFEGSLRTNECTTTIGYQLDMPPANLTFRGQLDSNWCIGAVLEKKLPPLPFTFALSAYANHVKGTYRFGMGLIVG